MFLWSRAGYGRSDPISLPRPLDYLERETAMVPKVLEAAGIEAPADRPQRRRHDRASARRGRRAAAEAIVTMAAHVFVEEVSIAGILEANTAWEQGDMRAARTLARRQRRLCLPWLVRYLARPAFRDWNIEQRLPDVHVPALAMQGADDQYGTPAQVEAIARQVSGPSEALLLPGAGHSAHIDQPDAVIGAISRFVREPADRLVLWHAVDLNLPRKRDEDTPTRKTHLQSLVTSPR